MVKIQVFTRFLVPIRAKREISSGWQDMVSSKVGPLSVFVPQAAIVSELVLFLLRPASFPSLHITPPPPHNWWENKSVRGCPPPPPPPPSQDSLFTLQFI